MDEIRLRESEERLRIAAQVGRMYAWEWDPASDSVRRSAECVDILGLSDEAVLGTANDYFSLIHPDDRGGLWSLVDALTSGNPVYRTQYRRFRPDGKLLWLEESGCATFNGDGKMVRLIGMTADITERKRAEELLRASEARERLRVKELETILDAVPVPVRIAYDPTCRRMTGNQAAYEQARVPLGGNCSMSAPPGERPHYRLMENGVQVAPDMLPMQQAAATGKPVYGRALTVVYEDGTERETVESAVPMLDEAGNPRGAVGTSIDLTEQKKAERLLRENEEKYRRVVDHLHDALMIDDAGGRVVFANDRFLQLFGIDREGLHQINLEDYVAPEWRVRLRERHERRIRGESVPEEFEYEGIRTNGQRVWIEVNVVPIRDLAGNVTHTQSVIREITERKQAQAALAGVSRRLIEAQEKERARIARELHDDIGQRLAMLTVDLGLLQQESPDLPAEVRSRVAELGKQSSEIATDIQSLSHELHSSKLQYLGLAAAMRGFCHEFAAQQNAQINFRVDDLPNPLPADVSLCLFRVLQEALHNCAKHSGVQDFDVRLRGTADEIHLTITDCGRGFDREAAKQGRGLGLVSMEERVKLLQGTFSIESQSERGTTIHARVPVGSSSESSAQLSDRC